MLLKEPSGRYAWAQPGLSRGAICGCPLRHQCRADFEEPATFSNVGTPLAVIAELGTSPDWLRRVPLRDPSRAEALVLYKLDPGEREAIALAQEHVGSLLLIDERRGRRYAIAAGLQVVGTAGMLVRAKRSGAVRPVLDALRAHGFHLSDAVYVQTLLAAGEAD